MRSALARKDVAAPRSALPYVDLLEAIRVVVRLFPDGDWLADIMTDRWIVDGYSQWGDGNYDDDDPTMVTLYGGEWRKLRPSVLSVYGKAVAVLERVLPLGRVGGIGVSCAREAAGPRKIEFFEWSTLQVELKRNLLATPVGKGFEDFPAIRSARVCTEDLQRECAAAVRAMLSAKPVVDLSALFRDEMNRTGRVLTQSAAYQIARKAGAIEPREKIIEVLRTLGGSDTPGPKGPRNNSAA